jgi:ribosomal protein S18 acetylase RimI-like enzyme
VVPRSWSLVWLAGAHREVPRATPAAWRERWADEAAGFGQAGMPATFDDAPNAGVAMSAEQERAEVASVATLAVVRQIVLPRFLRGAVARGWWSSERANPAGIEARALEADSTLRPTIVGPLASDNLDRLTLAARVVAPLDPVDAHSALVAAARDGAKIVAAVAGSVVVGLAILAPGQARPSDVLPPWDLLAIGVAPAFRQQGLGHALIRAAGEAVDGAPIDVAMGVAERDAVDPLPIETRTAIARRLLEGAGFNVRPADGAVGQSDPAAFIARRD